MGRQRQRRRRRKRSGSDSRARRLHIERLEDRRLLAAVTVTNNLDVVNGDTSSIDALIASDGGDGISLREAIEAANMDVVADVIDFDSGLAGDDIFLTTATGDIDITQPLTIDGSGLFIGLTIHAGHGLDSTSGTGDGIRVFDIDNGDDDTQMRVQLTGLTLTGGDNSDVGGAIRSTEDLTLLDMTIVDNTTTNAGGGISSIGNLTIQNSVIHQNTSGLGGGIQHQLGSLLILNSQILDNSTPGQAGGILSGVSTIEITDSTISGNSVSGFATAAAAISIFSSTMEIFGSTIADNHAVGYHDSIGSIWSRDSDVTLSHSTVSGNTSEATEEPKGGGGIHIDGGNWTIQHSTISGNSTNARGGGIQNEEGSLTILHSTITGNYAPEGYGSGLWSNSGSSTDIFSSIIAGNTNSDVDGSAGAIVSDGYNLIGTGDALGTLNQPGDQTGVLDPHLVPLTNSGGPTKTHALLAGSPAIDAGEPGIVAPPSYDQRGAPYQRIADGDADGTARIDIGAFEVPTTFVVTTEVDELDGVIDPNLGGAMSLREAITLANLTPQPINITFDASLNGATIMLDQAGLGALPTIEDSLSIDASNLTGGLTIHAGHGSDGLPATQDGVSVLRMSGGNFDAQVIGLTLTGGDSSPTGGGISAVLVNLVIVDTTIKNNSASIGGGIQISLADLTIIDSTISDNSAISGFGGGISGGSGYEDLVIVDSLITGNAAMVGGGVRNRFANATILYTTISANLATGVSAAGAGIASGNSVVRLTDSTVSDNSTIGLDNGEGGGISVNGGYWRITNSTITGNSSNREGGGILNEGGELIIQDSTITNNYAPDGRGSGILNQFETSTSTSIGSSIVAGNANSDIDIWIFDITNTFFSNGHNLVGSSSSTVNALAAFNQPGDQTGILDPRLGPLADNGGPTMTHALLPGSPALDAGNGGGANDQRGMSAPVDLPGIANAAGGDGSDIGAYEAQVNPSADFDSNLVVNGIDFLAWQRGFGLITGASLPDGNSDDDGDTDHSDFAAWEVSFGETLPLPLAAHSLVQTETFSPVLVEEQSIAPVVTLTAPDVLRLQKSRHTEPTGSFSGRVAYLQPDDRSAESADRALRELAPPNRHIAELMEFDISRLVALASVAAEEATIDKAFAELVEVGLGTTW